MQTDSASCLELYLCASNHDGDQRILGDLLVHLEQEVRAGKLRHWSGKDVPPGGSISGTMAAALASANVAILLLSPDFFADSNIQDVQLPALLARGGQGLRLLLVLARPCLWSEHSHLRDRQLLPSHGRPLTALDDTQRGEALVEICKTLADLRPGSQLTAKPPPPGNPVGANQRLARPGPPARTQDLLRSGPGRGPAPREHLPYQSYLRAIFEKFCHHATWLPGQKLSIGDIGTLDKGIFRRQHSLAELRISPDLKVERADAPVHLEHSSASELSFSANDGDEGPVEACIEFSSAGGFLLRAVGCIEHYAASPAELKGAILAAQARGLWQDDWIVIDGLYQADSMTTLVCTSEEGMLRLSATAAAQTGPFDIADADLGLLASASKGDITRLVAARTVVPMYSALRLQSSFWRRDRVIPAMRDGASSKEVLTVTIQDLFDE